MATDLLANLNPEQRQAVLHQGGPAMVLAGAGSGKTTVLTTRVAWLINQQQVAPHRLLVVTFTNKAAGEIKDRILAKTGSKLPYSGTFHSLCAKILRIDGQYIGLDPNFVIYDSEDQDQLIKDIYKQHGFDKNEFNPKAVKAAISSAKNEVITPKDYAEFASGAFQIFTAKVFTLYETELLKAQAVDFDDLMLKTLKLLQLNTTIRQKYQNLFEHVLIDEYQDTNTVQYQLSKILAAPQNNIYVVGDFSQSIYAWRGANYRNMLQLKKDFPDITEYRLEQNYRSDQNILDAATSVISHNTSHPILSLWTTKPAGHPITCLEAEGGREEATAVISYIKEHRHTVEYTDIAILYRTNAQSREFEEALIRAGIPYRLIGGTKFYERKEVKDVIAYLRFVLNRHDLVSANRIEKLGKKRLEVLQEWVHKQDLSQLTKTPPAEVIKEILSVTEYLEKYARETEENLQRVSNVQELLNVAAQFATPHQFLENVALIQNDYFIDAQKTEENAVNLMSLHAAKGLEFAVVCMVGMEDGLLPHSRAFFDPDQMEEERRLCYVGITRAKSKLYFTHARTRFQYGSTTGAIRSRFIADIAPHLLEIKGIGSSRYTTTTSHGKGSQTTSRRYIPLDDDMIEGVLSGDFDLDTFIDS
jgi:DNA helicase II / ATP-dependent DNA helicase PcrA